jgi:hypothetical protein
MRSLAREDARSEAGHHRSPAFRPGNPSSRCGVERSFSARFGKIEGIQVSSRRRPYDCPHSLVLPLVPGLRPNQAMTIFT